MNVFEYIMCREEFYEKCYPDKCIITDDKLELLNNLQPCYVRSWKWDLLSEFFEECYEGYVIYKAEMDKLKAIEIHIDDEVAEWDSEVRKPYFHIRGKKLPKALTDKLASAAESVRDELRLLHIGRDFIFPDGSVGINGITYKYPNINELIIDTVRLKMRVPCLDYIMAISSWVEYEYDKFINNDTVDKNFDKSIDIGIWVHDNKIEFLNAENAAAKYTEYKVAITDEDKMKYEFGVNWYKENCNQEEKSNV